MKTPFSILALIAILCFFSFPLHADDPDADTEPEVQEQPYKVSVFLDQSSVKSGMMFLAQVRVQSQGAMAERDLWGHSCSYEKHWDIDTENVFLQSWTCPEDHMEHIVLEPGSVYEKKLILYIKSDHTGPVTFRLGFKRMLQNGDEMEPIWSDPVSIRVIAPEGQGASSTDPQTSASSGTEVSETYPEGQNDPDGGTEPVS